MKINILFLAFSSSLHLMGQTWNWWSDDYVTGTGGGTYINVDAQGTDMAITGLVNDYATGQVGSECINVGIDNQQSKGVQHQYQFSFSNPVDVRFNIDKINEGSPCYNDFLSFTGSPKLSNQRNVTISGNNVFPLHAAPIEGFVRVSYDSVTNFTITHGAGISCNPGHIHICKFNLSKTYTGKFQSSEDIILFPNPAKNKFRIESKYDTSLDVKLFNMLGQLLNEQFILSNSTAYFDISNYSQGTYILLIIEKNKILEKKRLIIRR